MIVRKRAEFEEYFMKPLITMFTTRTLFFIYFDIKPQLLLTYTKKDS